MNMKLSARTALLDKRILLIISGGIAAYKSLELIRRLKENGARVRCILTEGGANFITPLSVSALSGEQVFTNLFGQENETRLSHIKLSRETDLIVVAPATANMLATMAQGRADTLAGAVLLASDKPILIAPAMNTHMWQHPATQANAKTLISRGVKMIGPAGGSLACGEDGPGRMSEASEILLAIQDHFAISGPLSGLNALVTSGPTFEPLDPVRFIGNRSSGKQGHAIAAALAAQGANVTLVAGPTSLAPPPNVRLISIQTAREMLEACQTSGPFDLAICAAAVADWRPETEASEKIKKGGATPILSLTENPDILATLSKDKKERPRLVVGFAAETGDLLQKAKDKFARKGCDWLLANDVGGNRVFGEDENEIVFFRKTADGEIESKAWPRASKQDVARRLVEAIQAFFDTAERDGSGT